MAKTNRRTKPATDARLTQPVSASTPTPSQSRPSKRKTQQQPTERSAATPIVARISKAPVSQSPVMPRSGSKQALILSLLSRQQGACLADMMEATGWLSHTTRAALTGLRQRGCTIERSISAGGASTYHFTNAAPAAADGGKV